MSFLHHIFAFDSNSPLLFTQFYFWAFFAIVYAVFALIIEAFPKARGNGRLHLRNIFLQADIPQQDHRPNETRTYVAGALGSY